MKTFLYQVLLCSLVLISNGKKAKEKPEWAKKDIKDFSDADLERLLDQWDEDEEPIPPDELPEGHPDRPVAPVDFSKLDMNNPEEVMKATKKGKTVMLFAKINNFVSREETEEVSSLWQTGLFNAHIQGERFQIEDNRVMFSFKDGSYAWEAKDFLLEQERIEDVQLEQQTYKGRYAQEESSDAERYKKKKQKEKEKKEKKEKKKKEKEAKKKQQEAEAKAKATLEKVEL